MKLFKWLLCLLPCSVLAGPTTYPLPITPPLQSYIEQVTSEHQFQPETLKSIFKNVRYVPEIIDKMNAPFEGAHWSTYEKYFLAPERIQDGVSFWKEHQATLSKVEKTYGVPAPVIVAISGVETRYGQHIGPYRAIDALTTLAFYYPQRSPYFTSELTQLLLLCREQKIDPFSLKGSYAGALGIPQFMPTAYRTYAVDYDHRGQSNIVAHVPDALASIGNYLQAKGWKADEPIAVPVSLKKPISDSLITNKPVLLQKTVTQWKALGVVPAQSVPNHLSAALISLTPAEGATPQYWLVFNNFKTILRYNSSNLYALAVYELNNSLVLSYNSAP